MTAALSRPVGLRGGGRLLAALVVARRRRLHERGLAVATAGEQVEVERDPETWLRTLFPTYFSAPFADHHREFWDWVWAIEPGVRPVPFVAVWARGGAKSTGAEAVCAALAARRRRPYALYVCGTQEQADDHVGNVATLLESRAMERYYPEVASRLVGKFGNPRGWRRNRLRTASGFTLDAIGLDTAARGVKVDEARPGLIILDDIDDELDSLATVTKKITMLTTKILPAGASDLAVLAIQNLIHPDSVFARLSDGRADFLLDRTVSGPHPAIHSLAYEQRAGGYHITAGEPTWAGQDIAVCEGLIRTIGLLAFLRECQHEVDDPPGGMFSHLDFRHCTWADLPDLVRTVVWVDPAVTDTADSDACGIQADGLASDGTIYRLFSWEDRAGPEAVMLRAIAKAVELRAEAIGVETDQGGDTWQSSYLRAWETYRRGAGLPETARPPTFRSARAGSGHGPKAHRAGQMLADYERGSIVHVTGTHTTLERALRRFPKKKPLDLVDAGYWSWADLRERLGPATGMLFGAEAPSKWRLE